jgi:tetratricopeptide (TPR) repeat protein
VRDAKLWVFLAFFALTTMVGTAVRGEDPAPVDPLTGTVQEGTGKSPSPPATPQADLTAVNDLVRTGAYAEAEARLAELETEFPDDPRVLLMHGEVLLALERPADALPLLEKTIELDPERPRANFQLGSILATTDRADDAIEAFGREIAINDDSAILVLARLNRAMLFQGKKAWGEAARELEAVVELEPARREAWGDLAAMYQNAGDLDAAAGALTRGGEAGFRSAQHCSSLGVAYHERGNYERAINMFRAALLVAPDDPSALKNLAASLQQAGRHAEAAARLKDYLRVRPNAPDAAEIAGRIEQLEK